MKPTSILFVLLAGLTLANALTLQHKEQYEITSIPNNEDFVL